jgi:hypothetical protein
VDPAKETVVGVVAEEDSVVAAGEVEAEVEEEAEEAAVEVADNQQQQQQRQPTHLGTD